MADTSVIALSGARRTSWTTDTDAELLTEVRRTDVAGRTLPISYRSIGALLAGADATAIIVLGGLTEWAYHRVAFDAPGDLARSLGVGGCCALLYVLSMQARQLYAPLNILNGRAPAWSAVATWCAAFCVLIALAFLAHLSLNLSRAATVLFFAAGAVSLPAMRVAARRAMITLIAENRLAGRRRVLLIGDTRILAATAIRANLLRHGYNVVGEAALSVSPDDPGTLDPAKLARIRLFVRDHRVDELFLAIDPGQQERVASAMSAFRVFPLPVQLICGPALNALVSRPITDLGPDRAIELQRGPLTLPQQLAKRALDLVCASAGLLVLAPLLVVIAAMIKLDSPGPALFRQRRVGFNGIIFSIFKFRSMTVMDDGAVVRQVTRGDDRVTRIGRWLRKTSIDELPQLLNVLRGEMSLVGPRPHALSHDNQYDALIASYAFRHHMKPGITGWAQVNGCRGETATLSAMERRIDFDLWYVEHWSLMLDIISLWRTVFQVFRPTDVY